ncbi:MAG: hypothetical protein R3293_25505, partial [Candidatus Promineifilaceae bacterium]|nr:hypothetical protein [Candidatus Promineifilaceae bacterium]
PGMPEAMMHRGTYEWLRGKKKKAQNWWQRGADMGEELNVHFDTGRLYLEMGKRGQDKDSLQRAASIFRETQSQWELVQAQEWLGKVG